MTLPSRDEIQRAANTLRSRESRLDVTGPAYGRTRDTVLRVLEACAQGHLVPSEEYLRQQEVMQPRLCPTCGVEMSPDERANEQESCTACEQAQLAAWLAKQ